MLVQERDLATTLAGASLTGAALTWTLGAWLQGRPTRRTPRWVLVCTGFLLVLAGIGLAAPRPSTGTGGVRRGRLDGRRLGMGLGLTSLSVLVLEVSLSRTRGPTRHPCR